MFYSGLLHANEKRIEVSLDHSELKADGDLIGSKTLNGDDTSAHQLINKFLSLNSVND